ncbi:cytokine inducing-glycoprotein [Cryptococcus gattii Ru294]|nr:cytokine inducing-glycoprotein [Cryptococcus gattii Ru294]
MIGGGDIALVQKTDAENVNILWTAESNPTLFHTFSTYSNSILEVGAGHFCQGAPDFSSLGFSEGDNATLLVIYQLAGADTYYYQCADISLVSNAKFTTDEQYVCGNYTSELEIASSEESLHLGNTTAAENSSGDSGYTGTASTSSGSTNPHVSSSSSGSKLSAADGGGIGASVTIFVVAVLAGLLWWSGLIHFGRKKRAVMHDHESVSSGVPTKERI